MGKTIGKQVNKCDTLTNKKLKILNNLIQPSVQDQEDLDQE